eukprot:5965765-Prymnesium_polylepis.1
MLVRAASARSVEVAPRVRCGRGGRQRVQPAVGPALQRPTVPAEYPQRARQPRQLPRLAQRLAQFRLQADVGRKPHEVEHAAHVRERLAVDVFVAVDRTGRRPGEQHPCLRPRGEAVQEGRLGLSRNVLRHLERHYPIPRSSERARQPLGQVGKLDAPSRHLLDLLGAIDADPPHRRRLQSKEGAVLAKAAAHVEDIATLKEAGQAAREALGHVVVAADLAVCSVEAKAARWSDAVMQAAQRACFPAVRRALRLERLEPLRARGVSQVLEALRRVILRRRAIAQMLQHTLPTQPRGARLGQRGRLLGGAVLRHPDRTIRRFHPA